MTADPSTGDAYEAEPWYYRFIERYTILLMWIGIIVCTLPFLAFTIVCLAVGAGAMIAPKIGDLALGGCFLFALWMAAAIAYGLNVLGIVFGSSWLLLAVDAARNLRGIRIKLPGH